MITVTLTSKQKLKIIQGDFKGDIDSVEETIQAFLDKNNASYQSHGSGYGALTINDKVHHITPYGIDINMIAEFCQIELSEHSSSFGMK